MVTEMTPEIGFDISRSPSAPATVSGDFSGAGDIFSGDPEYLKYYYSNVNSNQRLSPPLLSKSSCGGIGDKRKLNRGNELTNGSNNCDHLLFSKELGFDGYKEGHGWSGLGLPGLGLGNRQRSIAEIIQEDLNHSKSMSKIPSRPVSCNAFDENIADSEGQCDPLSSSDAVCTGGKVQGNSSTNNVGVSASFSYASALGASLSTSTTADSQFLARGPSPCLPVVGEGRVNSVDKRSVNSPTSLDGTPNEPSASANLAAALSGLNLSEDLQMDDEKQIRQQFQRGIDNHLNGNNLLGNVNNYVKQTSQLDATEFWPFPQQAVSCSAKGSYFTMGKGCEIKVDGLAEHKKQGGANSPTNFYSVDSPGSVIPNYDLSGHSVDPALASVMAGQFGHGALPPLFESPAASTIGIGGMDSRKLRGRISSQANLMDAASELKSFGRIGSQTASDGLQSSQVDPLHLHYLTSTNYTAAQLAALNDPSIDEANSYMDLLALQKAYLGTLLSPSESECGRPYLGKSAGLNHGYYSNPAFGIGSAYSGNPLVSSLLTHSPMGSGSLLRHGERNMRLPSAMRNIAAGFMGNWRSEASGFMDQSFGSSLLDEFKSNKTKCFELSEIAGHVVEFSADQYGSRFIQQKLETATTEEKNMVFREIIPQALSLMTDVFGNYVIQKFFEHGTSPQIKELADKLTGHVLTLSLQMYGCRVIQKAIEVVDLDQQKKMVVELDGNVMRCVRDQNGNHVIQKCIECVPEDAIHFIISTFYDQVVTLSTHPYGCRVIQRVLEHCHDIKTQHIVMDKIMHSVCMLAQDQYGNYVVQHVMEHGKPHERSAIISELNGKIVQMSQQKFASNVIEKCLAFGDAIERRMMVNEMLRSTDENEPLQVMMKDQFANYVVQKVMETCDDQQLEVILSRIKNHLNALKKYTYGKHIVARVEKLVAAGERRINLQSPYPATIV